MSHAEKCPVCKGSGKIKVEFLTNTIPIPSVYQNCHGCDGRGWVTIKDMIDMVGLVEQKNTEEAK